MKKDLGTLTAVFPMPVLMIGTYGENDEIDVMNCAWGQICDYDKIILFLAQDRKTLSNMKLNSGFTVSIADREHLSEADYFGMVSGNRTKDKFARTGMHAVPSDRVRAPIIEEFPVVMECILSEIIDTEHVFGIVGTIVNVKADESVITKDGKIDAGAMNALLFDPFENSYYTVGEKAGRAFHDGAALIQKP